MKKALKGGTSGQVENRFLTDVVLGFLKDPEALVGLGTLLVI